MNIMGVPSLLWLTHGMGVVVLSMLIESQNKGPLSLICFETWAQIMDGVRLWEEKTH